MSSEGVDAGDFGQVDAEDTIQMISQIESHLVSAGFVTILWPVQRFLSGINLGLERNQKLLNLKITRSNQLLIVPISRERLAQREDVFAPIIPNECFQRLRRRATAIS